MQSQLQPTGPAGPSSRHATIKESLAAAGFAVDYVKIGRGSTGVAREIRQNKAAERAILAQATSDKPQPTSPKGIYRKATSEEAKRGVAYVRNSDGTEFDRNMVRIKREPIRVELTEDESSCVAVLSYDADLSELTTVFRGNPVIYIYEAVTLGEFETLLKAESIGTHFNRFIKPDRKFRKVLPDPEPTTPASRPLPAVRDSVDAADLTPVPAAASLSHSSPWVYSVQDSYAVRVRTRDLEGFRRGCGFDADEDETRGFFLDSAEARWNGEWIPFSEALRLDDEASQYQPVAAGLALRSHIEEAA